MARLIHKRSRKIGLPPGTLVRIGEKTGGKTKIHLIEYDEHTFQEREIESLEGCLSSREAPAVTWVKVDGVDQIEIVEKLGSCFGLHPLALEDILNADQRPKIESYGEDLFLILKAVFYEDPANEISSGQISLVLRSNSVVSFQEKEDDLFAPLRERLRIGTGRVRKMGPDYLVYALLDIIVDHYFLILEKLGEKIEVLEARLVADPSASTLQEIQKLKREMVLFRKWVWPLREVISNLERGESPQIREATRIYLRDVYDHVIQVMDTIEILREMLSGMLDIYLSSLNNRMNAIMKVLTVIATIFMPLTFIAGIYGMNFKYMPELQWPWGYPAILLLMACIVGLMLWSFRRKKWL